VQLATSQVSPAVWWPLGAPRSQPTSPHPRVGRTVVPGAMISPALRGMMACTAIVTLPPLVFGRNFQCQPVRGVHTREEWHWSQACKRFTRTCVGTNGMLECKFRSKMCTVPTGIAPNLQSNVGGFVGVSTGACGFNTCMFTPVSAPPLLSMLLLPPGVPLLLC
jgi:hypothetical protein